MRRATIHLLLLSVAAAFVTAGCKTLAGTTHTGVIIARRAQIRSSTALVAADLAEVTRGDVLDIYESDSAENGERWLRVRTRSAESTEGWIESRNVMPQELLERSRRIADEDKTIPAQATGQLRASSNLRYSPDRGNNENILLKLESGAHFEIIGWKRVPKPKTSEATDSDDVPKSGAAPTNTNRRSAAEEESQKAPEEANELWYRVRLSPADSPAPAGWVFGKQVELTVPSDIIFYRGGREFVAWHRLDDNEQGTAPSDKDAGKEAQPGSWVILEKSTSADPSATDESDFDRIFVLGYDKTRQEHYTAYRSHDLRGRLPLTIENEGEAKYFVVRVDDGGGVKDLRFKFYKGDRGHIKVEVPEFPPQTKKK